MDLSWIVTAAALLLAAALFASARRASKRLDRLTDAYWELRYEVGQLRSQVARLNPEPRSPEPGEAPQPQAGGTAFVPLSSLKR